MYLRQTKKGWRCEVERNGVRKSAAFATKTAAKLWGASVEAELLAGKHGGLPRKTLADAIDRYIEEVSAGKEGERFERLRLEAFKRDFPALARKLLAEVSAADIASWRDARLKHVSGGSVRRDANLLRHVFNVAIREWEWLTLSPMIRVRMPADNPHRTRRVQPSEVKRICRWLGYRTGKAATKSQQTALAFLIALRTAMRLSEVLSLHSGNWSAARRVATVEHKMQYQTGRPREIPLTHAAIRLMSAIPGGFNVSADSASTLFARAVHSLLIDDLHFHDSRAEALTRFARKVDILTLARISGHRDLRQLQVYYRETSEQIAKRL